MANTFHACFLERVLHQYHLQVAQVQSEAFIDSIVYMTMAIVDWVFRLVNLAASVLLLILVRG